jgi:hypothetical protein
VAVVSYNRPAHATYTTHDPARNASGDEPRPTAYVTAVTAASHHRFVSWNAATVSATAAIHQYIVYFTVHAALYTWMGR